MPLLDPAPGLERFSIASANDVRVSFLGVSTLLIEDGHTRLLTDGFFSRPAWPKVLFDGEIAPDTERIEEAFRWWELDALDAVLVTHSHYDHAMDAGIVAARSGAMLLGSPSTRNIALGTVQSVEGIDLPDARIREVELGKSYDVGTFTIQFHASKHFPLRFRERKLIGTTVDAPLPMPAKVSEYGEGATYSILITHERGSALIHASAGYIEGALDGVRADVVFLGASMPLGSETGYVDDYWREVVKMTGARRVYPVHWDNPSRRLTEDLLITQALRSTPRLVDDMEATLNRLRELGQSRQPVVDVSLLPFGQPVALFDDVDQR